MLNILIILLGKTLSRIISYLKLGNGSTWPGHLALKVNKHFVRQLLKHSSIKTIFVVGTNGKTTTTGLINHLLQVSNHTVIQNTSGANLLNGIASALLLNASLTGKVKGEYLLLEIDENAFIQVIKEITPDYLVILNLFRDQLDRYGEVASIASKWQEVVKKLPLSSTLILNADDPQVAYIGEKRENNVHYFGLEDKAQKAVALEHASDSIFCPHCNTKLTYTRIAYSHLGVWHCSSCHFNRPTPELTHSSHYSLSGTYNKYNTHAALLLGKIMGISPELLIKGVKSFKPAFGRQEELYINDKKVEIILAKNPTGFNESLRTIDELKAKNVLIILNDRIADGKDVSWIWDVDFEEHLPRFTSLTLAGDRVHDLAVRIKYAHSQPTLQAEIKSTLKDALSYALDMTKKNETLFILPTYTAMLEVRELLVGRKIL